MKKLVAFLSSKTFFANLVLGGLLFVTLFVGLNLWLDSTTNHGETISLPDLAGMNLEDASATLEANALLGRIIDSAEYNPDYPLGAIINQYPSAGSQVKEGREIFLTINPFVKRKIPLPEIIEKPLRRAVYDLESKGFVVGERTYKPDIAKDAVLAMEVNGEPFEPGEKFEKGTVVDLIVGAGLSNQRVPIPYLKFLTAEEAESKIIANSLNLGIAVFDEEVTDSSSAIVYRQSPQPSHDPKRFMGETIDIWLTNDSTKIVNDSLAFKYPDMDLDSIKNYFEADSTILGD